jgi:hypothetical protein
MVAKKIELGSGLKFASIGEAKTYFDKILKTTPLEQRVGHRNQGHSRHDIERGPAARQRLRVFRMT